MDVNSVGPSASSAIRFSYTEHAEKLAAANKAARLDTAAAVVDPQTASANVPTSASYSPQIYAQAAHFQVLAQAGAFAALQNAQSVPAPKTTPPDVAKVDAVGGATVDTVG